jgi:hypothetical protein
MYSWVTWTRDCGSRCGYTRSNSIEACSLYNCRRRRTKGSGSPYTNWPLLWLLMSLSVVFLRWLSQAKKSLFRALEVIIVVAGIRKRTSSTWSHHSCTQSTNLTLKVFEPLTGWWLFHAHAGKPRIAEACHLAHMCPLVESKFDPTIVSKESNSGDYSKEKSTELCLMRLQNWRNSLLGKLRVIAADARTIEAVLRVYNTGESGLIKCASHLRAVLQQPKM